jgi:hypothetical protein
MRAIRMRRTGWLAIFALGICANYDTGKFSSAEKPPAVVYVAPIEGIIDLGLAPFVQRALKEAANANAFGRHSRNQYFRRARRPILLRLRPLSKAPMPASYPTVSLSSPKHRS